MNWFKTRLVFVAAQIILAPASSLAQAANDAQSRLTTQLAASELFQQVAQEGGFSALDTGHLPGASVLSEMSLGLNASQSGAEYSFPIKLGLPLFKRLPAPDVFRLSEIEINYSPATITQEATAGATSLKRDVGQEASFSYKLPLFKGPRQTAREIAASTLSASRSAAALSAFGAAGADIDTAIFLLAKSDPAIGEWQTQLWKNFKLSQDIAYKARWAANKQDELAFTLSAEKGFGTSRLTKLAAQAGWSHFRPEGTLSEYQGTRAGGSATVRLTTGIGASAKLTVTKFDGAGFLGIRGVADKSKDTDVVFTQSITFAIAGGEVLSFSVKESHLGTGSVALGLLTEFGYVLKRR